MLVGAIPWKYVPVVAMVMAEPSLAPLRLANSTCTYKTGCCTSARALHALYTVKPLYNMVARA